MDDVIIVDPSLGMEEVKQDDIGSFDMVNSDVDGEVLERIWGADWKNKFCIF